MNANAGRLLLQRAGAARPGRWPADPCGTARRRPTTSATSASCSRRPSTSGALDGRADAPTTRERARRVPARLRGARTRRPLRRLGAARPSRPARGRRRAGAARGRRTTSPTCSRRGRLYFPFELDWDQAMLMFQPVGGMDRLPYALADALSAARSATRAEVREITTTDDGVEVVFRDPAGRSAADRGRLLHLHDPAARCCRRSRRTSPPT